MFFARAAFCFLFLTVFSPGPSFAKSSPEMEARAALDQMLKKYSQGELRGAEALIEPTMIGYQQLVDSMRESQSRQKQIRISMKNVQATTGKDIVVIRADWEKRFLASPSPEARVSKGRTLFLMQLLKKEWKLSSQSGDNIFAM